MKIYCINLDRHPQRLERMREGLKDLPLERIVAVDGANCPGPDYRDLSVRATAETLTRFEQACLASHRLAWTRFLETSAPFACVLEDDVLLSRDFSAFIQDAAWIPAGCNVVKLETYLEPVMLSRATLPARDRSLAEIRSVHYGSAAYLLNRVGAERLLAATAEPSRPVDEIIFSTEYLQAIEPVWQLVPALCVQAQRCPGSVELDELKSSIQPPRCKKKKPALQRWQAEASRPFRQMAEAIRRWRFQQQTRSTRQIVPHA